jgi:hypothetical protein
MIMIDELEELEEVGRRRRVGVGGCGCLVGCGAGPSELPFKIDVISC